MSAPGKKPEAATLVQQIRQWGNALGFQQVGITDTDLTVAEQRLHSWLARDFHGDMNYMQRHGHKRSRPAELVPGTLSVISVRMDYLPPERNSATLQTDPAEALVSRYAMGKDYHKLLRKRLQQLARRIQQEIGEFGYRVFVDSAPVLEKPLAEKAGLGWIGKHTNLINRSAGSWFFLGELYTDLRLPPDAPGVQHCGRCTACMDICPTRAIVAPFQLDARRCISYLTIELQGTIPEQLRSLLGNHIYGCDDCQLVCPWNRFARTSTEPAFLPRNGLDAAALLDLFAWSEDTFLKRLEGSPIRRIGHQSWLRNIAVALGNSAGGRDVVTALQSRREHPSPIVREHVDWALAQLHKEGRQTSG